MPVKGLLWAYPIDLMCVRGVYFMYMKSAVINFKVDPKLKASAQARAKKLGISLSMVLNDRLKEFASGKSMSIDFPEEQMTPHMEQLIAEIEAEVASGNTSGPFETLEAFKTHLVSLNDHQDD